MYALTVDTHLVNSLLIIIILSFILVSWLNFKSLAGTSSGKKIICDRKTITIISNYIKMTAALITSIFLLIPIYSALVVHSLSILMIIAFLYLNAFILYIGNYKITKKFKLKILTVVLPFYAILILILIIAIIIRS